MLIILFYQFSKSQSLNDISNRLGSANGNFNHLIIMEDSVKIYRP
ncbi:hypothetical protein SAMN04487911_14310 [Arenibacter nanhaiticus]|uniref:Uncharacterized protein n=1 Tax=Arenibacter nanhaiticus TaxID=558155 RepID=A0A1M6MJT2_9FLAO|nr:hypothetical protein SAMN04487911_14310 [Arenibacter nanhaiticus]